MKPISLQDISNELNISKATISYVLNGRGDEKRIAKKTQERILEYTQKHNYQANLLARALSLGKSDMIGLIVPNISDTFFARIARRIETKAEEFNYNVVFSSTGENGEKESKLIRSMLDRQVDGLIIATCQKNSKDILQLKKRNFPFVLIDRYYPGIETNYVGMDNTTSIAVAVEQLIKNGRKRIGFISLTDKLDPLRDRFNSYVQTMQKHNLPVEEGFTHELPYNNIENGMREIMGQMVNSAVNVDGIVFATHFLTAFGLRTLKELNVRVPEDVALVSFGQISDFDLVEPPVTSIILPSDEIGDKAVEILLQNMNEREMVYQNIQVKTKLIVRKSCGTK